MTNWRPISLNQKLLPQSRRHGDTVGYFIPVRRKRSEAERAALKEASESWQEVIDSSGISEEEAVTDFERWRGKQKR